MICRIEREIDFISFVFLNNFALNNASPILEPFIKACALYIHFMNDGALGSEGFSYCTAFKLISSDLIIPH